MACQHFPYSSTRRFIFIMAAIALTLFLAMGCDLLFPFTTTTTTVTTTTTLPPAGSIQWESSTYSVNEESMVASIIVSRSGGTYGEVGIHYSTADGTALASGNDYEVSSGSLHWSNGDSASKTISISIHNDAVHEDPESFSVTLSNVSGGASIGSPARTTITINDDDPPAGSLQFSSSSYVVNEGTASITIDVTRTDGSFGVVWISYATSQESASATTDYTTKSGVLTWANGDTGSKSFTVSILNDSMYEEDERFRVALSTPTGGATMGTPSFAWVTIQDNDPVPPAGSLHDTGESVVEQYSP
jgi:hypothetical protein